MEQTMNLLIYKYVKRMKRFGVDVMSKKQRGNTHENSMVHMAKIKCATYSDKAVNQSNVLRFDMLHPL